MVKNSQIMLSDRNNSENYKKSSRKIKTICKFKLKPKLPVVTCPSPREPVNTTASKIHFKLYSFVSFKYSKIIIVCHISLAHSQDQTKNLSINWAKFKIRSFLNLMVSKLFFFL